MGFNSRVNRNIFFGSEIVWKTLVISIFGPAVLAFKLSATDVEAFSIKIPFVPFSSFFFWFASVEELSTMKVGETWRETKIRIPINLTTRN